MKPIHAALAACTVLTGVVAWRCGLLITSARTGPRGSLYAMPLVCITSGMLLSLAWMEHQGKPAGPWRIIIVEILFLVIMLLVYWSGPGA